ncbi:MAG: ribosome small subunit-dependent GTPase A [Deltaproteobacteria bacterium]|nr:MAG: ribosome small subunit-dependent GTPase A [Deltaproteobacteria bacterium]
MRVPRRRTQRSREIPSDARPGRVVETVGRRVLVRDDEGERTCFLAGHRVVIGDRVRWIEARGEGGKIVAVDERDTALVRMDHKGREQVLAANLGGLLIVVSAKEPGFRAALLDRYLVAADVFGLEAALVVTKVDLGVDDETEAQIARRAADGLQVLRTAIDPPAGIDEVAAFLAEHADEHPWALVGSSGVGKTSLVQALLPQQDVGPVGEISEFWGTGRHTTTASRLFALPGGGEIADSPGIRNFTPAGLSAQDIGLHFPRVRELVCKYRDCLHRPGEDGCVAEQELSEPLLDSYRTLLGEVLDLEERRY